MATCDDYATQLAEASAALHKLLTGTRVVEVNTGEKVTRFAPSDVADLRLYIRDLQAKVDACNGVRGRRHALRFIPQDLDGGC